jgi:nitrate/nitrite-specific signal transduction histidine kinase
VYDLPQVQPEELRGDELSEIYVRLQNQLNQKKTDMQMKSEELNFLIRSAQHRHTHTHHHFKD